ncbi:hypothetical protein JWV37_03565 [Sulfurospirillum sp. T05]|uniref:Helix-turn-helix domain-containing protein n=1 Tax=Sulfurospirillum tamanense TaxID=2813362 RepID=A0ABS2WQE5_9BACT|nr:helix-turn-helix domain-containing protein [Sulfurospirillum tamanensis]MBN2963850.1 hypothetical protein [Sulfurospirillum tamanensis]
MSEKSKIQLGFTTIQHDPRLKFKLTNNEYCVADAIYHLSHNPSSIAIGWCYASRQKIGAFFGLSRQTTIKIIQNLISKNLVEVNSETQFLRTTQKWYDEFVNFELMRRGVKKVDTP